MSTVNISRRPFLQAAALTVPYFFSQRKTLAEETVAKNDRPVVGAIGVGGRGSGIAAGARRYGDIVAICDVDQSHAQRNNGRLAKGKADLYTDYRKLLERKDIDLVTIGTPDHWHTKIAVEAMLAGKDVYCEKPLTLTIDEGKLICKVAKQTERVFQVGTQQRSEFRNRFLKAVAMAHSGRLGEIKRVSAAIGGTPTKNSGPFASSTPPQALDWEKWQGQAPEQEYIRERTHGTFRWWYEYSGGKMTDWGAHHVDIAQWAIGALETGPVSVEPVFAKHLVPCEEGMPTRTDTFNTATEFRVLCKFASGAELTIRHDTDNGVLIEGTKGRIFVSRSRLTGKPIEDLADQPLPEDALLKLRRGKPFSSHMANFIDCTRDRSLPISDVYTHHRTLTTCHLANIAVRLGRGFTWDPEKEQIVGDDQANGFLSRPQRKGYEIDAEVGAKA